MRSLRFATLTLALCILPFNVLSAQEKMERSDKEGKAAATQSDAATAAPPKAKGISTSAPTSAAGAKSVSPAAKPPFVGRLPRYFSKVVSPEQRETIYEIQYSFRAKIEQLQAELDALKDEQSQAVEAVLSKVQMEQVNTLRDQALQSRAGRATTKRDVTDSKSKAESQDG